MMTKNQIPKRRNGETQMQWLDRVAAACLAQDNLSDGFPVCLLMHKIKKINVRDD